MPLFDLESSIVVLDGALGTELERRGVATPGPLWSAAALQSAPEVVRQIHRDYANAGAQLHTANTFRVCADAFEAVGKSDIEGRAAAVQAVSLARDAAQRRDGAPYWVAASLAPAGDCYRPDLTPGDARLRALHGRTLDWLALASPDCVLIETQNSIREAAICCELAAARRMPLIVSFILREDGLLLGGDRLSEAVRAVEEYSPLAIGLNCVPPSAAGDCLPLLMGLTSRPVAFYPHLSQGSPIPGWSAAETLDADEFADLALDCLTIGARIVGGCCGTTPSHLAAFCQSLSVRGSPTAL